MCDTTIRHDLDDHSVVETAMHNASTLVDELDVILAVRSLPKFAADAVRNATGELVSVREHLLTALTLLPTIGGN